MKTEQINWNSIHNKAPHIERIIVKDSSSQMVLKLSFFSKIYIVTCMFFSLSVFIFSMIFYESMILSILSFIFFLFYIYLIIEKFPILVFDKLTQKYFTSKGNKIDFDNIYAFQAISEGRSLSTYYELNIILNDGKRYPLCCYSYYIGVKPFIEAINKISKITNKPILIHPNDKNLADY